MPMATNGYPARRMRLELDSRALRAGVPVRLWAPRSAGRGPRPLLLVHDGADYVRRASLLRLLERTTAVRAALVEPVEREEQYSASPAYTRALVRELLPAFDAGGPRIGLGASLGALALLHAHRTAPESLDGLFLQSGSFFRRSTDGQERRFPRFRRIDHFVGDVLAGEPTRPIPVTITCGREENLENNRAVAAALERQGYDVRFHEHPGGHGWPAWKRALDPHLEELLCRVT
jgi:enterochelin esterase-like enzyme